MIAVLHVLSTPDNITLRKPDNWLKSTCDRVYGINCKSGIMYRNSMIVRSEGLSGN